MNRINYVIASLLILSGATHGSRPPQIPHSEGTLLPVHTTSVHLIRAQSDAQTMSTLIKAQKAKIKSQEVHIQDLTKRLETCQSEKEKLADIVDTFEHAKANALIDEIQADMDRDAYARHQSTDWDAYIREIEAHKAHDSD